MTSAPVPRVDGIASRFGERTLGHRSPGLLDEVGGGGLGDELAFADDDEVGGGEAHFGEEVAGDQDGASLVGEVVHEFADPEDAFGVESVDGFVEEQDLEVAGECCGDAEALAHAEGEAACAAVGDGR